MKIITISYDKPNMYIGPYFPGEEIEIIDILTKAIETIKADSKISWRNILPYSQTENE